MHTTLRRAAALAEVAGVFICGTIASRLVAKGLALETRGLRDLAPGESPDWIALASSTATQLVLRYGIILALAFAIGWWHRRRSLREYGLAKPMMEWRAMAALFAAAMLLPKLIVFAKDYINLGEQPEHWKLIRDYGTPGFWLYMAVGSFVLVPLVEELLFRGYVQTRLAEDFGAGVAIVMTALFFALAHRQYFLPSGIGIGMIVSLLFGALVACYVRHVSGSLWPGVVAHAIGNIPMSGWVLAAFNVVLVTIVIAYRKRLELRRLMPEPRDLALGTGIAVTVTVIVLGAALVAPAVLMVMGVTAVVFAVVAIRTDSRRTPSHST